MPSLLTKSSGPARPRLAVSVGGSDVYAARTNDAVGVMTQISHAQVDTFASLSAGVSERDHGSLTGALRDVLSRLQVGKLRDVSLVIPDTAARVFLLDFDALPAAEDEVLPILRFRLTRLLPFPADAAQVSYQVMGQRAGVLQVLVVATPYEALAIYENAVREAGFEPGAVLPSTLAVLSGLPPGPEPVFVANGGDTWMTTAIQHGERLLLHRTLELANVDQPSILDETGAQSIAEVEEPAPLVTLAPLGEPLGCEVAEHTDVLRAIAVTLAFFEDEFGQPPTGILVAGTLAGGRSAGWVREFGIPVTELPAREDLTAAATVPSYLGALAAVRGALRQP